MSEIARFFSWDGDGMRPANNGDYVRYDDHLAEVERVARQNSENFAEAECLKNAIDHLTDHLMSERDEAQDEVKRLKEQVAALTLAVEQADELKAHAEAAAAAEEAETDRVMSERDAAQIEVERLKRMLPPTAHTGIRNGPGEGSWSVFAGKVVEERDEAREEVERLNAEVKRLTEQVGALTLTLALEQADEMKAHAEAETDRVTAERDEAREKLTRVQVQYDEFAKVTAKVIEQHQRERDHARQQVYRLQQAGADRPTDQSAQNLDMANGQAILDSSRPDDETIWREAFMSAVHDVHKNWMDVADVALAQYRKRWPR